MITIALDEGGQFEPRSADGKQLKCMYIGGVVFQCRNDSARKQELTRLQDFLKEKCDSNSCIYPRDLHYNRDDYNNIINWECANKVKKAIIEELPDFFNGKGRWSSNKPNGIYYLYALVGDENGINYFEDNGIDKMDTENELSNLIDDDISSNRYEHMAYRAIENLLFYNISLRDKNVRLNLATRVFKVNDKNLEKESLQTGHEKHEYYESNSLFKVTTLSSYRACLISMIQNSNRKDLHFDDIRVGSICYDDKPDINFNQGFLYLSDIVCNVYNSILKYYKRADTGLEQLWQQCQQYAPKRIFCWSYNDFDQEYRSAYKAYERGDYYTALSIMYKLSNDNKSNYWVYENLWFDLIKKNILFNGSAENLNKAIEELDTNLNNSRIPVSEARFIYELLKKRVEELCFVKHNIPILFHLYKAEFAINNHEGKYTEAFCSFEKCKEVAQYVNVEEYLELRNMYSVSLCDSGDFHKAKEETEKTLSYEELLVEIKKEVFSENDKVFIHYGRTQSQLGQCYAFAGEYEKAIGLFKNAIKSFGEDKNDINQTLSYLLHAAIEANNISVYEEYSGQYFGTKNRREQLLEILSEDNIANSFALYVYIKAYYMLYMTSCDRKETLDILREVERCKKNKENKNHPWEMIYKYVAFCCLKIGNKEYNDKADKYISLAKIETDQGILKKIIDEIDVQYKSLLAGKDAFENSELTYMYR